MITPLKNWTTAEILLIDDNQIDEASPFNNNMTSDNDFKGLYVGLDPNSSLAYGGALLGALRSGLSKNFDVSVKDFGPQLVVDLIYHNIKTCKSAGMTFMIVITGKDGSGWVKSSVVRYRSIGNVTQAATYILSRKGELISKTE